HLDRLQCLPAIAGGFRIVFHCCYSLDDGITDGRWRGAAAWSLRANRFLDVDGMDHARPEHMHGIPTSNARTCDSRVTSRFATDTRQALSRSRPRRDLA
ncbi:MAG TPA: hypothetical protein PLU79_13695, partial [Burkholderiaceae bacterium]|nr:hypothetical protein [Burkholderiaceae bacterium]